jgi:hypothetical protein
MSPEIRFLLKLPVSRPIGNAARARSFYFHVRYLHNTPNIRATPIPHPTAPGPPPEPPRPIASDAKERLTRKLKQAELLRKGEALRKETSTNPSPLQKRFWKNVSVKETPSRLFRKLFRDV